MDMKRICAGTPTSALSRRELSVPPPFSAFAVAAARLRQSITSSFVAPLPDARPTSAVR